MTFIPRLIAILSIVAKYRLVEFIRGTSFSLYVRIALLPFSLRWLFSSSKSQSKEERLRLALEELGPIYIKLGQLISTRKDFLDPFLANELAALQDNVPPFTSPSITQILKDSLGEDILSRFSTIAETPFASASVAQVYEATLSTGEEVVIKVTRPGLEKLVRADLSVLKWLAKFIEEKFTLGKRLRPIEVIDDYEKVILGELDLAQEAANTSELRRHFDQSDELYVPIIHWDFVSRNTMVMEKIDGIPVSDIQQLEEHKIDFKTLAETGVNIFFTQVFEHNFFHADMHPGNIFVSKNQDKPPQYIAIDCAIIGSLTESDQEYLAKNLLAIFRREYRKVAELHVACGWVPMDTNITEFESAIRTVCEPIFEKPLKEISFANVLIELFRTASKFDMRVQPSLVLLQKTLLNVEGLGRQLYPDLDLWETAHPFLEDWQSRRLNPLTLLNKLKDNLPELLEKLPQMPLLIAQTASRQQEFSELKQALENELTRSKGARDKARSRNLTVGFMLLATAGLSLIPAIQVIIQDASLLTAGLLLGGFYLLYFRR